MGAFSMGSSMVLWQEMLPGEEGALINPLLQSQYDLVYGSWPNDYNEIVLVLDEDNELDDHGPLRPGPKAPGGDGRHHGGGGGPVRGGVGPVQLDL